MIGLYSPDVPPVPGGVSDHTLVLARALAARGSAPVVLARRGEPARFDPVPCHLLGGHAELPAACARHGLRALVIQYVPFLFARRGVSPGLVSAARAARRQGVALVLVLHELFVPFTRLPWLVTGWPMRWQLQLLLRAARTAFTPVPAFAAMARRLAGPGTPVRVAPIGATLPLSTATRAQARRALGLADTDVAVGIFSPAAAGYRPDWVRAAAERLALEPRAVVVAFGHGSEGFVLPAAGRRLVPGPGDAESTSRTMRALDLLMAPYVDGLTMRRSGAMLALAHGVPVASSRGHLFDPAMEEFAACEADHASFVSRVAELVGDDAARAGWAARAAASRAVSTPDALATEILASLASNPARAA